MQPRPWGHTQKKSLLNLDILEKLHEDWLLSFGMTFWAILKPSGDSLNVTKTCF